MGNTFNEFAKIVKHPVRFRIFLLLKLPSAYFSGVRIKKLDEQECVVTVPYKWFSRNPFRSTYFACLAMAAEMSTGALAIAHLYKRKPAISMLVIKVEANYFKKAVGKTIFTCSEGKNIEETIEKANSSGEAHSIVAKTIGINEAGELIAEVFITWSFKKKSKP
jgi:hypothetical protein